MKSLLTLIFNVKDMRMNWSVQDCWPYGFHGNRHGFMVFIVIMVFIMVVMVIIMVIMVIMVISMVSMVIMVIQVSTSGDNKVCWPYLRIPPPPVSN